MHDFLFTRILSMGITSLLFCACAETPQAVATSDSPPTVEKPAATTALLPGRITQIALADLFALQQSGKVLIYDVRPSFFHSLGHIPGSVSWPKSAYEKQLATREREIRKAVQSGFPVVLYCTDLACPDAHTVAKRLAERGHHTSILEGGWDAWDAGGLPGS